MKDFTGNQLLGTRALRKQLTVLTLLASLATMNTMAADPAEKDSTPVLKLSAKSLKGKIEDKSLVKEWSALTGPALVYNEVTDVKPPVFTASSPSSSPAVYFAPGTCLGIKGFSKQYLAGKSFTIFVRSIPVTPYFGLCGNAFQGGSAAPRLYLCAAQFVYNETANSILAIPTEKKYVNQETLFIYHYDAGSGTMKYFLNGTLQGEKSGVSPVDSFGGGGSIAIPWLAGDKPQEGYLLDLIVFNSALSSEEIKKVSDSILK
jgi:hypothetical protein